MGYTQITANKLTEAGEVTAVTVTPSAATPATPDVAELGAGTSKLTFTSVAVGGDSEVSVEIVQGEGDATLEVTVVEKLITITLPSSEGTPVAVTADDVKSAYDLVAEAVALATVASGGAGTVAVGSANLEGGEPAADSVEGFQVVSYLSGSTALSVKTSGSTTLTLVDGDAPDSNGDDLVITVTGSKTICLPAIQSKYFTGAKLTVKSSAAVEVTCYRMV